LARADAEATLGQPLERDYAMVDLLRRPGVSFDDVAEAARRAAIEPTVSRETMRLALGRVNADAVIEQVQIAVKYEGYVERQNAAVARDSSDRDSLIPADIDYAGIAALSFEVRQTLSRLRPESLDQATRLPGVTPAAIAVLRVFLKRLRRASSESRDLKSAA
jgi:tRNA uridine 5-carboxymethylaminomethyl modification enzyme